MTFSGSEFLNDLYLLVFETSSLIRDTGFYFLYFKKKKNHPVILYCMAKIKSHSSCLLFFLEYIV